MTIVLHHFVGAFLPFLLHKNYPTFFAATLHPNLITTIFSSPIITLFFNGTFAVVIFFVLSGYVLTIPYYRNNQDSFALHKRLWGRYLRLNIPVAAAILFSYLIYTCHGYFNIEAAAVSGSTTWLNLFFKPGLSHVTAFRDMLWRSLLQGESNFNPVFWTLKIEFIASVYLLLFYIAKPKGNNFIFLIFCLLLIFSINDKTPIFLLAVLMGSSLNMVTLPKKWQPWILICGLYFGAFQYENNIYNFLPAVPPWHQQNFYNTIGALLVAAPILNGYGSKLFESRLFQFLGTISFPLYLLHFTILSSFSCWLYLVLPHTLLTLCINFFLYVLLSIGLSVLFEKYIDKPAIALSHRFAAAFFRN